MIYQTSGIVDKWLLPVNGAGCGDVKMEFDGTELTVRYQTLPSSNALIGRLLFSSVIMYQYRNELHSDGRADGSYDCVVQVKKSELIRKLKKIEPGEIYFGADECSHYAVLFSSNGYLDVVCKSFEFFSPEEGTL